MKEALKITTADNFSKEQSNFLRKQEELFIILYTLLYVFFFFFFLELVLKNSRIPAV